MLEVERLRRRLDRPLAEQSTRPSPCWSTAGARGRRRGGDRAAPGPGAGPGAGPAVAVLSKPAVPASPASSSAPPPARPRTRRARGRPGRPTAAGPELGRWGSRPAVEVAAGLVEGGRGRRRGAVVRRVQPCRAGAEHGVGSEVASRVARHARRRPDRRRGGAHPGGRGSPPTGPRSPGWWPGSPRSRRPRRGCVRSASAVQLATVRARSAALPSRTAVPVPVEVVEAAARGRVVAAATAGRRRPPRQRRCGRRHRPEVDPPTTRPLDPLLPTCSGRSWPDLGDRQGGCPRRQLGITDKGTVTLRACPEVQPHHGPARYPQRSA